MLNHQGTKTPSFTKKNEKLTWISLVFLVLLGELGVLVVCFFIRDHARP